MEQDAKEHLDCRNVVEATFPTTLISLLAIGSNKPATHCFHDGCPLQSPKTIVFQGIVFCSLACALAGAGANEAEILFLFSPPGIQKPVIAPPRAKLARYGGTLSLAQFRGAPGATTEQQVLPRACLYDCHPAPLELKLPEFFCDSIFCSYNCMLSFCLDNVSIGSIVETKIRNSVTHNLIPAPPRKLLDIFGGPLSIEEFRVSSRKKYFKILQPRCLISLTETLLPLGQNVAQFNSHCEVHEFDRLDVRPGEYTVGSVPVVPPVLLRPASAAQPIQKAAPRTSAAPVVQKMCSGKLPFRRV
jgi:hypothetical protein